VEATLPRTAGVGIADAPDDTTSAGKRAERPRYQMSLSERMLLGRLVKRDEDAFNQIVRAYSDRVYNLVLRLVGSPSEAEDIAQEVFVTVFKSIDTYRGEAKLSTWILRIAANHSKNRIKYLSRRRTTGQELKDGTDATEMADEGKAPVQAHFEAPDVMLEAAETEQLLQEAIAKLDEEQRLLVVLRDVEELSYDEIAEITGLPEGTVKSRLHRARMALKDLLEGKFK
jgi:RNA polymerase sigma-70 factor (ECF subfamily)